MLSLVSIQFIGFLIAVFAAYFLLYKIKPQFQWCVILVFSIAYFYMAAGIKAFIPLAIVLFSTYLSAFALGKMSDGAGRKALFIAALILEIGTLAFFKYAGYISSHTDDGTILHTVFSSVAMYLGISFYVFQCTGYLIDVYRRKYEPEKNIFKYALFASFFCQIGQGPIGRYDRLSPTLFSPHEFDYDRFTTGAVRTLVGFFKKAVIADNLAMLVDMVYEDPASHCGLILIIISVLYSLQLYADFSGYMDIVLGVGMQLGVTLDENFDTPYFATSIRDFWKRWHITLSTWLKDYVYIPLGGSRKGTVRKCVNQMLTMLISGIWHGTGINFIIWGGIHGAFQVAENFLPGYKDKKEPTGVVKYIRMVLAFVVVDIAWVFFRIPDIETIGVIIHQITHAFILNGADFFREIYIFGVCGRSFWIWMIGAMIVWFVMDIIRTKQPVETFIMERKAVIRWIILIVLLMATAMYAFDPDVNSNNFIYYQF